MPNFKILKFFTQLRIRLRDVDEWPQLLLLGLISGVSSALVIVAFRATIDYAMVLTNNEDTHFLQFSNLERALVVFVGAVLLGLVFQIISTRNQKTGIKYVLDTLANRGSVFAWPNTFVQFFGGAFAIITGQSVGREGPAVHLGAATSSGIGHWLMLSSPQLRLLAGCGVAAAIAASFNTPIAGVLFAMEVILMEYTAAGLFPIIVAATSATAISRIVYGTDPAFQVPALTQVTLVDAPWLIMSGIAIGILATIFIALHRHAQRFLHHPPLLRFGVVGALTALVAYFIPQITGVGYDVVQANLGGFVPIMFLILLIATKLVLTPIANGVGIPGGVIAATMVIGACIGGLVDQLNGIATDEAKVSTYVIIGMGTMMSAVLNAPLSALTAVMELTYAPDVLMPTMASIIVANIVCREVLKQKGIFERPLSEQSPWRLWAQSTPVSRVMNTRVVTLTISSVKESLNTLTASVDWVVITYKDEPVYLMTPDELRSAMLAHNDLTDLEQSLKPKDLTTLAITNSAWDAIDKIKQQKTDIAIVRRMHGKLRGTVMGIVTPNYIDKKFKDIL